MVYKVTTAVASNYESQTQWKKSENSWRMDIFTELKNEHCALRKVGL